MRREESNIRRNWPKYRRITNKQETGKTRWRRQKKQSSGDGAGQQHWPSEPRPVGEGNEYLQSPAAVVPGGAEMGIGFEDQGLELMLFVCSSSSRIGSFPIPGPQKVRSQSSQISHSYTNGVGWVPIFATSSVSLGMEPVFYSRSPNQEVPKNYTLAFGGQGSKRILLVELSANVPNNILCKMGGDIQNNFSLVELI